MSNVQLINADCLEYMRGMDANSIDMVLTSPPYDNLRTYNGYTFNFEGVAQQLVRILKPGGVIVWVVADQTLNGSESGTSFKQALYFKSLGLNLHDTMIYEVAGTGAKGSHLSYWQAFEYMFVFSNGKPSAINLIADKRNINAGSIATGRSCVDGTPKNEPPHPINKIGIRTNVWRYSVGFANRDDRTEHPPRSLKRLRGITS